MGDKKGSGKFILGAALGAIAGAVAGIVLAPKSGEETLKDIKGTGKKLVEKTKSVGSETVKELDKKAKKTKK